MYFLYHKLYILGTYNSEFIAGLMYNEFGTSAEQSEFYLVHFRSFFAAIIFLVIIMCTNFPNWVCFHRSQKKSATKPQLYRKDDYLKISKS